MIAHDGVRSVPAALQFRDRDEGTGVLVLQRGLHPNVGAPCDSPLVEVRPEEDARLASVLLQMKSFSATGSYYALTLGADVCGTPFWSCQSHWTGWSGRNPGWEIRAASLVSPGAMTRLCDVAGQDWATVHDDASLSVYTLLGGNVLVEKTVAETRLAPVLVPAECVHDGPARRPA